jgi:hypothetical protein
MTPETRKAVNAASDAIQKQLTSWGLNEDQRLWGHLRGNAMQSITMSAELEDLKGDKNHEGLREYANEKFDVTPPTPENAGKLDADYQTNEGYGQVYEYVQTLLELLKRTGARAAIDSLNEKGTTMQAGLR